MGERSADWMRQAERDLEHARVSLGAEDFDWACFAAQQAAEALGDAQAILEHCQSEIRRSRRGA